MVARLLACLAVAVLTAVGRARADEPAPPARYNEGSATSVRTDLERRIESLVATMAKAERRNPPRPEARLERAATALALDGTKDGPSNELVEAALRLYGLVEPPPHLIIASAGRDADEALLDELRSQLPHALASGRYTRVAAAVVTRGDSLRVIVALQESFLELEAVPRALPSGGPAPLRGRLLAGFERPGAFVTAPDGKTEQLTLGGDARRFQGTFHCGPERGAYQVEITGEDRFGSTVLANFPIYCGRAAPTTLSVPRQAAEAVVTDGVSAEAAVLRLVAQDRARAGLPPLVPDTRLAEVARAHCRDMLAHGFVGHVSPSTGSAADRVARAKIRASLILENVARAYTPGEVERGLMASPGHRRNILSGDVTRIGVGAMLSEALGGARELLVTQVFIAEEAPFHVATRDELRARIDELRRGLGLPELLRDPELDRIADGVAHDLASGRATPETSREPLDRAMSGLGARYSGVRSLFAIATQITQVVESLKAALTVHGRPPAIGIGLAPGSVAATHGGEAHLAHHAVLLLATPR